MSDNCEDMGLLNSSEIILTPQSVNTLVVESYYEEDQTSADPYRVLNKQFINIYPVPANDYLNVDLNENAFESYEIAGIEGRILLRQNIPLYTNNVQITINNLPSGMYFLRMNSETNTLVEKFIVR